MTSSTLAAAHPISITREGRHPAGLVVLFATEMWERFSFYTMLALFTLYLRDKTGFGWNAEQATTLYANYLMLVYGGPLLGGYIADRKLGFRRAVTIGGVFFTIGHVLLAFPTVPLLYAALACLVVGNAFFKPNVSSLVGSLYAEGSPLRDSAYTIFYMGINIGAFLAPLVAEAVRQRYGFHPAFVVAGGGMILGMLVFWTFQKKVTEGEQRAAATDATATARGDEKSSLSAVPERKRIAALLVIFAIAIVFFMVFHQNGSTLTYWANENTDWTSSAAIPAIVRAISFGFIQPDQISGVVSNAINPFWIIVLTFPLIAFWKWLNGKGMEPSTPSKMAIGMLFTGAAFALLWVAGRAGGDSGKVSPWWLIWFYFVLSIGELMLSPMGLSLVSKVAPKGKRGLLMGGWFVATAIGSKLTQIGVLWTRWPHSSFFLLLSALALGTAFLLLFALKGLKRAMPGV